MEAAQQADYINILVVKVVRSCNLRCTYCYYINGDTLDYGSSMDMGTLRALFERYRDYLLAREKQGAIVWHGGEPLMLGRKRFSDILALQKETGLAPVIHNKLQTNGLLVDDAWIDFFRENDIGIGVSIDMNSEIHDRYRITPKGEGTYAQSVAALKKLQKAGIKAGVLSVAPEGCKDGRKALQDLRTLGVADLDILLPMTNNARQRSAGHGIDVDSLAEFMVGAFKEWVRGDDPSMRIRLFASMILKALGRETTYLATGGNSMASLAVVETDGSICLDTEFSQLVRFAMADDYTIGLNVNAEGFTFDSVEELITVLIAQVGGNSLPSECQHCSVARLCGGGHPGTRYDVDRSHDHPSAHCRIMYSLGREVLGYLNNPQAYV